MKSVLVVSYHFPPEESSCSEKNIRLVKLLLHHGYKVIVLTKPGIGGYCINDPNVEIIRTNSAGFFHRAVGSSDCAQLKKTSVNSWKTKLKKWGSANIIPDGTIDWYRPAKDAIKHNIGKLKDCSCILSISSPYSAHFVSRFASKLLGIPFVMSYGDPWIYEPKRKRGVIRHFIEKHLEGDLIKDAAKILLITQWNKQKYQELYNIPEEKILTFHIGYDQEDVLDIHYERKGDFRVLYGGSLDPVHRDPEPYLKAMRSILGIKTDIFCNDNPKVQDYIRDYHIEDKVSLKPLIKASEFNRMMYNYDALLLFGNKTPFQVPGKVFTYIATGKTIIYIKNNSYVDDGTEEVLRKYGNAIIVQNNSEDILNCMGDISTFLKSAIQSNPSQFEFHNTMMPTISAIESVI